MNNDDYRREIAMANYNAAQALSMDKITDMYLQHFKTLQPVKKSKEKLIGNI